jgi:rod shape-determining protein MreD
MRWLRFAVFILIVTMLQAGVVDRVAVTRWHIRPDLLLILLVFFAIYCNTSEAIITSFTIGFAADILIVGSPMGSQMLSFGLFGTLLAYLHRVVSFRKIPYQSAAIFITGVLAGTLAYLLGLLKGHAASPNIFAVIFGTSLYSSLVGPFFFLPAAWWMRIKTHRLRKS